MSEKIMTLHPEAGKAGVNIERVKYDQIRTAILAALQDGELGFWEMVRMLEGQLAGEFEGSIPWYVTTVKLDLEARGLIARVPQASPQRLRLGGSGQA